MIENYLEPHEMQQLELLLSYAVRDTISCWKSTRLKGVSASMACEGNVSVQLLQAFDVIAKAAQKKH